MENKRQEKKKNQAKLMALILCGLMVFSAVSGVLVMLLAK